MEGVKIEKADSITVSTGFQSLDALIGGGFSGGELVVLGGRPSTGKTTFAIHISLQAALKESIPVLLFSLEMSKEMIAQRMLSALTDMRTEDLKTGNLSSEDWPRLTSAANALSEAPIHAIDSVNTSVSKIASMGRELKFEHGGLMIVDYLQLLDGDFSDGKNLLIEETMEHLSHIAKELQIPVLILSQIARSCFNNGDRKPNIIDPISKKNIEPYADKVLLIHRTGHEISGVGEKPQDSELAELILAKNRNGPVVAIELAFRESCGRLEEIR